MNYRHFFVVNLLLSTTLAAPAAFADPHDKEDWEAQKHYWEHQRESQKHYRELERENQKMRHEIAREERKHQKEMEKEARKHWKEMHKEHKHYRDDGQYDHDDDRGYYEAVSHPSYSPHWGGYDVRYSTRYGADNYGISQGQCNPSQMAASTGIGGGGVTGALGNAISNAVGGSNSMMGAIAGTVVNQMLGNRAGQSMEAGDRFCFSQSLEYGYDQRRVTWVNPNTNSQHHVVPLRSYQNPNGNWCREFNYQLTQNGRLMDNSTRAACRMADGNWQ
jgi:surface antigen